MFCVIYKFCVKPGKESEFEKKWHDGVEPIVTERGGLGSRLHKNQLGDYIAYAQWPSRDKWEDKAQASGYLQNILTDMKACLQKSEVIFELDVLDDLLKK